MSDQHVKALAERLILAKLTNDEYSYSIVADEIGDDSHCWRNIAGYLGETAAAHLSFGDRGAAIEFTEWRIAAALDGQAES
jgi:hypothetical protein